MQLHDLPSSSPNLHLIERAWKFFHEKVRRNRFYETFADFQEACKGFFRKRMKWTKELRTRLTENFQKITMLQIKNG